MMNSIQTPLRVLIADDQPQVRSALRFLLENQEAAWNITGEAVDTLGLLAAVEQRQADLILLDWELPGLGERGHRDRAATELVTRLRACGRPVIIAISGYCEARQQACAAGVDAFISKTEPPDRFLAALRGAISERVV